MKDKIEQMERRIRILERDKRIMNDNLTDQARLIISLGKKVMRMDILIKENIKEKVASNFNLY
jgi:hypothetical protein